MIYTPRPVDTSHIALDDDLLALTEQLAHHAHEVWAAERLRQGWTWGPTRHDERREHPCLVPYDDLPDAEKQFDRNAALETLKVIQALGYRVVR